MSNTGGKLTKKLTHADLVKLAAHWLWVHQRCPLVFTEMVTDETPDAIGWRRGALSLVVECKATRSDFLANRRKTRLGMGRQRWFLVPSGLVRPEEVEAGRGDWGLIEWDGKNYHETLEAQVRSRYGQQAEMRLLISALRRIGPKPTGVSVKVYTTQTKNRAYAFIEMERQAAMSFEKTGTKGLLTRGQVRAGLKLTQAQVKDLEKQYGKHEFCYQCGSTNLGPVDDQVLYPGYKECRNCGSSDLDAG